MQGACIVRRDLEGFIKTESILKSGLKLRLASCLPDLIITIRGKTNCFVLPAFSKADALCEGIDMALERLAKTKFFFYEREVDPVSLAIELSVSLNQVDASVQIRADDMLCNQVSAWIAMEVALTSIRCGNNVESEQKNSSNCQPLSKESARDLSIFQCLHDIAMKDSIELIECTRLTLTEADALADFFLSSPLQRHDGEVGEAACNSNVIYNRQ
ncbi:hypothetical protein CEUSTIGMA_g13630.t1 [Chlamydomonas eustigma]|uniref:Uncharacterized protein n=1 Tax=Chlamydomonas eustigma TaxID=1157962 RepID=A0A250XT20_9CHLO|nr:hypothetical protein CEUSTIGMA_g13630.t1 [Chlamydomonas eustigma]|eukprot:GAX86217.1 hypothetical protein CEUSTIGMA_g13630.t1 [Chlamydomonas eustigma]